MRKIQIIALLVAFANYAYACSCSRPTLQQHINQTDFIATAKILKINENPSNKEYHDIEVELIDVYKGLRTTKLKIWSTLNSSCSFFTPVGTTWLIFASYDKEKILNFHYCSGALQLDRKFDLKEYPGLDKKYASEISLKLKVLQFFKDRKLMPVTKIQQPLTSPEVCYDKAKGFKGDNYDFAVYERTINEDMSFSNVKVIKSFLNKKLNGVFYQCVSNNLIIKSSSVKSIQKKSKQYLVYYFYPAEKGDKSFVSVFDL